MDAATKDSFHFPEEIFRSGGILDLNCWSNDITRVVIEKVVLKGFFASFLLLCYFGVDPTLFADPLDSNLWPRSLPAALFRCVIFLGDGMRELLFDLYRSLTPNLLGRVGVVLGRGVALQTLIGVDFDLPLEIRANFGHRRMLQECYTMVECRYE